MAPFRRAADLISDSVMLLALAMHIDRHSMSLDVFTWNERKHLVIKTASNCKALHRFDCNESGERAPRPNLRAMRTTQQTLQISQIYDLPRGEVELDVNGLLLLDFTALPSKFGFDFLKLNAFSLRERCNSCLPCSL